ncbi:MAG: nuclease (SNase domain protein) [Ilumatobacteraceae bacterium]|nr:nuclease (SNase domain protein) [Ilumatobacteraceae bacterium]
MSRSTSRCAALALILVGLLAGAGCATPGRPSTVALPGGGRGLPATVTHVVDGDTVDLEIAGATERARLLGIDTPETVKPNAPVECYGPEASARTKALLPAGTAVAVQRDREARDRYGRLLVYLWRREDGRFVNASLVRDGFARTLSIEPNTSRRAELAAEVNAARAGGAGLWGTCPPDG